MMSDNVLSIDAFLAEGTKHHFGPLENTPSQALAALRVVLLDVGAREAAEIDARFPKVMRRVGGYNLDALVPKDKPHNLAHLLVGS